MSTNSTDMLKYLTYNTISSSIFRKFVFSGAMYIAGASIISAVGLTPVVVAGTIIWML